MKTGRLSFSVAMLFLLVVIPLLGACLWGLPVSRYLEFPPTTQYVEHAPFSPWVFAFLLLGTCLVVLPFVAWDLFHASLDRERIVTAAFFPRWGWAGVILGIVAWVLAWTRQPWCAAVQPHLFSFQWLAYILVVNALKYRKTGECMVTHRTRYWLTLFVVSAVFWWFFEYLNRFVQNWYYEGAEGVGPLEYFLRATIPFSTVLPAVLGTYELLAEGTRTGRGLEGLFSICPRRPRLLAGLALAAAVMGLAGLGIWPDFLFPLLWISPLVIIVGLQGLFGRPTLLSPLADGNWRRVYVLALSALICGFFWEMWNFYSDPKWLYSVPFVHRFQIFEMPLLGYAGYLPFGLECAVIADVFASRKADGRLGTES